MSSSSASNLSSSAGSVGSAAPLASRLQPQAMDVYETPDVEVNEQLDFRPMTIKIQKKSDDVTQQSIKPSLAFAKFAGKIYENQPDPTIIRTSSTLANEPFDVHFEAPMERYQRLKREIQQFQEDMQAIAQQTSNGSQVDSSIHELSTFLTTQLAQLNTQLQALSSETPLKADVDPTVPVASMNVIPSMSSVNSILSEWQTNGTIPPFPATFDSLVHDSHSPPISSSDGVNFPDLISIEKRIASLESTVGVSSSVTKLSKDCSYPDVSTAVAALHKKLSLLDPARLEQISRTVKSILSDLELVREKEREAATPQSTSTSTSNSTSAATSASTSLTTQQTAQIKELYEMMPKWDSVSATIPGVVSRLLSLRSLHEHGAHTLTRLTALENEQAMITQTLEKDRTALEKVSTSLADNLQLMQSNLAGLEQRMAALNKKMEMLQ